MVVVEWDAKRQSQSSSVLAWLIGFGCGVLAGNGASSGAGLDVMQRIVTEMKARIARMVSECFTSKMNSVRMINHQQ